MKKIYLLTLIICSVFISKANAQYFQKYYLYQNIPVLISCVEKSSMGGFIATANYYDSVNYCHHPLIIKFNDAGSVDWAKSIDIPTGWYAGTAQKIKEVPGEGYVILGSCALSPFGGAEGIFLLKIDYNGISLWQHCYDSNSEYYDGLEREILFLSSGNILFTALKSDLRIYLLKTDHQGNALLGKTFTADTNCTLVLSYNSVELDNGDIMTIGLNNGMLVFKTNSSLNLKWSKNYLPTTDMTWFESIRKSMDGNVYIAGRGRDSVINSKIWITLLKMDTAGTVLWEKKYTFQNNTWLRFNGFTQLADSSILISYLRDTTTQLFMLMKTDQDGNLLYSKQIDSTYSPDGMNGGWVNEYSIKNFNGDSIIISEGNYLFMSSSQGIFNCGAMNYPITQSPLIFNNNSYTSFMVHGSYLSPVAINWTFTNVSVTEGDYCSLLGIQKEDEQNKYEIIISPNPASTEFQISNFNFQTGDEMILTDALGKISFSKKITSLTSNFKLQTSNFTNGIYFLEIKTKEGVLNKKVVVEH